MEGHTATFNDGTLLPENVANMVTTVSLATRISLRCSSLLFDTMFEAAKYGTSLSLGISRNAISNVLSTAKNLHTPAQQKITQSSSTKQEERLYENNSLFLKVLEKYTNIGLYIVSHTFSLAELFAMSGLQFTSRTIQSSLKAAEESVRIIDGIFGSNDTSRAIASIITLVHRELVQDPDFGLAKAGKMAILTGLTKALTAFAVLQNVTHQRMMKQIPMTVLWEGLVTEDDSQKHNSLVQFKQKKPHKEIQDDTIIKELTAFVNKKDQQESTYKITTTTTRLTTKTTTITPIDSTFNKRITVKTDEEETESYLANKKILDPTFILKSLSEKRRRRKVERQEQVDQQQQSSPKKRASFSSFSSESYAITTTENEQGYHCHQQKKRSSSISSCSDHNGSIQTRTATATSSLSMTSSSYNNSIPTSAAEIVAPADYEDFPQYHIVNNIAHFMRYASAAYGESFMRILGIGDIPTVLPNSHHHHPNHHAFAHHTGNSVEDILLSSYTDRSPLHLHNPSIHALVHYVTVDHAAKAIVLTCRGTLGLSDILTDLSFDYTEFNLPTNSQKVFKAHSGMLDAAQLLAKEKGKVYQKIRQGLVSYPDYGLVMCGHSLGGGVASLLCVLWSEQTQSLIKASSIQDTNMPLFVTSSQSGLPAGRPIHCYAYGPPGVMSLELSSYCAGLVTSVVHGYDIVSSLSLGLLKDFKNVATSLHAEGDVAEEIISRVVGRLQQKKKNKNDEVTEDDQWFWAMIKTMRADMKAEKMYPPSTVYLIETIPQVKQQHKVVLCRCENVEARFSEIVFTRTMFMDHSPLMYERAIRKLCRGFTNSYNNIDDEQDSFYVD